jgi:hypothetical protein
MTVAEKLTEIADNMPLVYAAGAAEREKELAQKYYIGEIEGKDSNTLTLDLPFLPDSVSVCTFGALAMSTGLTYNMFTLNRRAFGKRVAAMGLLDGSLTNRFAAINMSAADNYIAVDGNRILFTPPQSSYYATSLWRSGVRYLVTAVRSDKSDTELLAEEIAELSDEGGSITFSEKRIGETVSDEEWAELIAAKPNWTFELI